MQRLRFGVDIGGTFTDLVCLDEENRLVEVEKVLTDAGEPQEGVIAGLQLLAERGMPMSSAVSFVHATTLVTNLILEGKGGPTALVTTRGLTDLIEIGREYRYDVYDLDIELPRPVVPRSLRFGVGERVAYDGTVLEPLVEQDVLALGEMLKAADVRAVAVAFLHSYANPDHERRTGELLRGMLPDVAISLSHEVHAEPKEYERLSTTTLDAHVKPMVAHYLSRLQSRIGDLGASCDMSVMLSNGGAASVQTVTDFPIQIIESGPAAGVEAAGFHARNLGLDNCLSFDMGGTTAKLCLVSDGAAARSKHFETNRVHRFRGGSGLPVAVPVFDLLEIGAGGGSKARINDLGLLQVGPDSAGSEPGPACYGRGGTDPTITDADLMLGFLDAESFLGGTMRLDLRAATDAVRSKVAEPSGLDVEVAALGVHDLVNETMAAAARVYCAEKGEAPENLTLIAFGGAGPVHALGLARRLGCPRVVIPQFPGVMSAFGLLVADRAFERRRAFRALLDAEGVQLARNVAMELETAARAHIREDGERHVAWFAELRHIGQDHPLEVSFDDGPDALHGLLNAFRQAYVQLYGRADDDNPIEFASLRAQVTMSSPKPSPATLEPGQAEPLGYRATFFSRADGYVQTPVYRRQELGAGQTIDGPAIIEERESTTVVWPGDTLLVHPNGSLVIDVAVADAQATRRQEEVADHA